MKPIIILFIAACSEALYPPPNYNSIVKPSSTYLKPDQPQNQELHPSSLPSIVPQYTKPPSHLYFTQSTAAPSVSNAASTQAPSYSYHHGSSSSAFSATPPSPTLSASYEYIIPNVTPTPQHHFSSAAPIIQQQFTNSPNTASSYSSSSSPSHSYHHGSSSSAFSATPPSPTLSTSYEYIIPNVTPTPQHHFSSAAPIIQQQFTNSANTPSSFSSSSVASSAAVSAPLISSHYQYVIPANFSETIPAVSDNPPKIPGTQHTVNTHYTIIPSAVTAQNPTAAIHSPPPAYGVPHVSTTPVCEHKKSDVGHQEAITPLVKTEYEYVIANLPSASVAPAKTSQIAHSFIPLHNAGHDQSEALVAGYGVSHTAQTQIVNLPIKTAATNSPASVAFVSSDNVVPEHDVYHHPEAVKYESEVDHTKQSHSISPLIKTSYEYIIPSNSPSTSAPVSKYDYSQFHRIPTPQHSAPSVSAVSVNGLGCGVQNQQQPISPSAIPNAPSVHPPLLDDDVTHHVQPAISPPVITNYEYVIPVSTSVPVGSSSIQQHGDLHIPSYEYGTLQQHLNSPSTQLNNQYVVLQSATVSTPSTPVANIVSNTEYVVPNKSEASVEVKVPVQTSYHYNIPNQFATTSTPHLNGIVASVPTLITPLSEQGISKPQVAYQPLQINNQHVISHPTTTPTPSNPSIAVLNFSNTQYGIPNKAIKNSYEYSIPNQSVIKSQEYGAPAVTSQPIILPVQTVSVNTPEHGSLQSYLNNQPVHTNNGHVVSQFVPTTSIPAIPSAEYGVPNKAETPLVTSIPIETSYQYNIQSHTGQSQKPGPPAAFSSPIILPAPVASVPTIEHGGLHLSAPSSQHDDLQTHSKPIEANNQYVSSQPAPATTSSNPTSSILNTQISTEHEVQSNTETPVEIKAPVESSYEYSIPSQTVSTSLPQQYGTPTVSTPPIILLHAEYGVPH